MTKQRDITADLAHTLEIQPSTILVYKQYPDGFTVLTTDFKKFTEVQPTTPPPQPNIYPPEMPDDLRIIYDDPYHAKVQELKDLAYFLEIPNASALKKAALQEEITAYKKENS